MKRIISLAVAGALLLGTVCTAGAVEIKPKAQWDFSFGWVENAGYTKSAPSFLDRGHGGPNTDNFEARHRARVGADMIISEQLSATVYFEIGDIVWGNDKPGKMGPGSGAGLGADGVNVETKHAYLDWMIPGTKAKFRMGIQTLALPHFSGAGNPVFNHDVAGIAFNVPVIDELGITAFWARPYDAFGNDDGSAGVNVNKNDDVDMFALILPITLDGMKISPYGMYVSIGNQSGIWGTPGGTNAGYGTAGSTNGWAAGLAYQLTMFDPLTFSISGVYSKVEGQGAGNSKNPEVGGWFIDGALNYKLDFATAGLFAWYGTGDDAGDVEDGKFGRAASFGNDTGFGYTSFGQFGPYNRPGITTDNVISNSSFGTWGVGIELADITFIEKLTHTIRVAYYQGTNDNDVVKNNAGLFGNRRATILQSNDRIYMTDEDSAWEVNFDHQYKIYENLTAYLELGYINMDLDGGTWGNTANGSRTDDAWKAMLSFQFRF